jgi:hypothetical protein
MDILLVQPYPVLSAYVQYTTFLSVPSGGPTDCADPPLPPTPVIDVWSYPGDTELPSVRLRMKCSKCGGRNVDVRPNWKEQPPAESLTGKQWR